MWEMLQKHKWAKWKGLKEQIQWKKFKLNGWFERFNIRRQKHALKRLVDLL
jgi:hypothetical protein